MKIVRAAVAASLAASLMLSACKTTPEKEKAVEAAKTKPKTTLADQNGDTAFQGFLNRLRMAVKHHDVDTIASMMTTDFGYRLEPLGEGPGVFAYWDQNNVWPELELVLNERFVPSGEVFMVAPPEFVQQSTEYTGYRAGIKLQNGSWKFAYFVSGQ